MPEDVVLGVEDVTAGYRSPVLWDVSVHLRRGELVTLVGSNGAGKTTLLNVISGVLRTQEGTIWLKGRNVTNRETDEIVKGGLVMCPEGRQLFAKMSVLENLEMGAFTRGPGWEQDLDMVYSLFPILKERAHQRAGSLSGGQQQMVAIGRALMSGADVLLFDEPSLGLAPQMVDLVADTIASLNAEGKTVLLVEQNLEMAFRIAQRAYVMENGRIVLEGAVAELKEDPRVQAAYLGGAVHVDEGESTTKPEDGTGQRRREGNDLESAG